MILYVAIIMIILLIYTVFILLIKRNRYKLKMKKEYGVVIKAKVIDWESIPGRPTRYIIKVEYEMDEKKENKTLITSGKIARKYEKEKSIQIAIIPNSNKIFFEEEDWKKQNILLFILLIFSIPFLMPMLLMCLIEINLLY